MNFKAWLQSANPGEVSKKKEKTSDNQEATNCFLVVNKQ